MTDARRLYELARDGFPEAENLISTAIREAEARGAQRADTLLLEVHSHEWTADDHAHLNDASCDLLRRIRDHLAAEKITHSRKPIEASENDGMAEGYNGA